MKRAVSGAVGVLLMLALLCPMTVRAEEPEGKTIRVGYVNALNYEEGGPGEYKRGAGYEYLQKISYLTGWKYEYVYGSFTECYEMLKNGEIDLFGNVSYTAERAKEINFSAYPQGKDTYWLYTSKTHPEIANGNIQLLNGCRIGVTDGSYQEGLLTDWLASNGIRATVVRCGGYSDLMEKLNDGELDVIVATDLSASYDCRALVSIGFSDYYFATAKGRTDVLEELNAALYEIQNSETDYNGRLFSRYYYKTASGLAFNEEENAWLAEHDNTIRLGYFGDNLPFSGDEKGELTGILATVMDALEQEYGITVDATAYDDLQQMKDALNNGEIDVAGPIVEDFYLAEQDGFVLTDSIVDMTPVIIYKGEDYNDSLNVIAATESAMFGPDIMKVLFPDAEIYRCASQKECLKAVSSGKAGSTLIPSSRINILNADPLMQNLSFAEIAKRTEVGLLVSGENRRVASIVNKGIEQSSDLLSGVVLAQHSVASEPMTLREFFSSHAGFFIGISAVIILVLGMLLWGLTNSRKQLVAALDDARNANSANIAKTRFLNNMSHDIRTPLNGIIGLLKIDEAHFDDRELVLSNHKKMMTSADHLLSLINDVLEMSKLEDGSTVLTHEYIDLQELTLSIVNIVVDRATEAGIRWEYERGKSVIPYPYVYGSPVHLRQIFLNIYGNCIKYNRPGGKITTIVDTVGEKDGVCAYRWTISDTGIGMSQEFLQHIFDPFTQERNDARSVYQGTGLGMTIVKNLVDLMHGTIKITSEEGVGSTFVIVLPFEIAEKRDEPVKKEEPEIAGLQGLRLLLAEDNALNAEIAQTLLEDEGAKVVVVENGKQALDEFANNPTGTYDAILMDIMMPEMDGYEATRAIRALDRPDAAAIPIIAMTANAFREDAQKCLEAGMNAHLAKPIEVAKLRKTIQQVVEERREKPQSEQ